MTTSKPMPTKKSKKGKSKKSETSAPVETSVPVETTSPVETASVKTASSKTASKTASTKTASAKTASAKTASKTSSVKTASVKTASVKSASVKSASVKANEQVEPTETKKSLNYDSHMTETLESLTLEFSNVLNRLNELSSTITTVKNEVRKLEKHTNRELKTSLKLNAKRKRKVGNRAPSGFVKPTLISSELASFLGKEEGSEMARTEVTKELNCYIRSHSLQDKSNGRKINADKKLSALLKLNKNDELTYFNLQKYMSPHFAKANNNKNVVVATSSL